MKTFSILILFCLIHILICDKDGVTQKTLQEAFNTSLPFIKSFHPSPFTLSGSKSIRPSLSYTELNSNNIQFKFDEYGLLHLKFVNIKGKLWSSTISMSYIDGKRRFRFINKFTAELDNISWEETYAVESTNRGGGKYDVKFKSMTESSISYNIFRFTMSNSSKEEQIKTKSEIRNLDFSPLKSHLKKISGLILETLQNRLK